MLQRETLQVQQLLTIGGMIRKSATAKDIFQLAELEFGRDHFFEQYSKLLVVAQRASGGVPEFDMMVAGIFSHMIRKREADPFSKTELTHKSGPIAFWLFARRMNKYLMSHYCSCPGSSQPAQIKAFQIMESPLEWLRACPPSDNSADQTWMSALRPVVRASLDFSMRLMGRSFNQILKGCLASPPPGPSGLLPSAFLEAGEMKEEKKKLDDLLRQESGEVEEEVPPSGAAKSSPQKSAAILGEEDKVDTLQALEKDSLERAADLIKRSMVFIIPDPAGPASQLSNIIKSQELTTLKRRFMAFYDPKCAMLARVYTRQNKLQRVSRQTNF